MFDLRARIAKKLGYSHVEFGAKVRGNVKLGKRVYIASGAELIAYNKEEIIIGDNGFVLKGSMLHPYGGKIVIGNNVGINLYCIIYGMGGVTIGDNVMMATSCVIVSANHNFERTDIPMNLQGVTCEEVKIGNDVWLGARVTILAGVEIGEGSVIGAGSVVTKSIPPYSVAVGVPARVVKQRVCSGQENRLRI
jgi:acetyltransferase-like isoleucine patch superfamily enzyme